MASKKSEDEKPEAKPPEAKPPEAKPPEAKPPETKPPETKPPETKSPETKPPETKPPETKPPETKPPETKPPETKRYEPADDPGTVKSQPKEQQETVLLFGEAVDRKSLEAKAKDELIDIIFELNTKLMRTTTQVGLEDVPLPFKIDIDKIEVEVEEYIRTPTIILGRRFGQPDTTWRIILISSRPDQKPLALEVHAPIIIGRGEGDVTPHVDLNKYAAEELGVSRRHALLRPTDTGLFLTDLHSTNGTYCNSVKLEPGVAQELKSGDTISLGLLHFKLRIVSQPKKSAA